MASVVSGPLKAATEALAERCRRTIYLEALTAAPITMRGPGRRAAAGLLLAVLTSTTSLAAQQPKAPVVTASKTQTSGLALSAGFGTDYVMLGVQAAYYLQIPASLFRVVPYASVGTLCHEGDCARGAVFGALGSWGKRHRVVVDAFYGPVVAYSLSMHGEPAVTKAYSGTGLALGYEYMAHSGFFVRGGIGGAYAFGPPIIAPGKLFHVALTLVGVGFKFW